MTHAEYVSAYFEMLALGLAVLSGVAAIVGVIGMWLRAVAALRGRRARPDDDEAFYAELTYNLIGFLGAVGLVLTGHLVLGLVAMGAMLVVVMALDAPRGGVEEAA